MQLTSFTYSSGITGYVPVEALKTFERKKAAVLTLTELSAEPIQPANASELQSQAERAILAANRLIKRHSWFCYDEQEAAQLVKSGQATIAT